MSHHNKIIKILFSATLYLMISGVSQAGTWSWLGSDKVVVVGVNSDPGHFNPAITTGKNVHVVADSMFNGLVALDRKLSPVIVGKARFISDYPSAIPRASRCLP